MALCHPFFEGKPLEVFYRDGFVKSPSIADPLTGMEAYLPTDSGKGVFLQDFSESGIEITPAVQSHDGRDILTQWAGLAARGKPACEYRFFETPCARSVDCGRLLGRSHGGLNQSRFFHWTFLTDS
jgi:hypothetical protein